MSIKQCQKQGKKQTSDAEVGVDAFLHVTTVSGRGYLFLYTGRLSKRVSLG